LDLILFKFKIFDKLIFKLFYQDIANRIGAIVMQKSDEVWDKLTEIKKWTVLSSIVLTDDNDVNFYDVICITSGTKCVKGDSLSMNGFALNDCHAEVLARRCFLNYIYLQIEKIIENNFEGLKILKIFSSSEKIN